MNKPGELIWRESMEDLVARVRPRIEQIMGRYRIPAMDQEDILQEALLSTLARWDSIKDPEAWLLVTVRNRSLVYWRKRRSSLFEAVDASILALLAEPIQDSTEDEKIELSQILEELPPRCRKLLKLRYGLGYDATEVAEAMGYHSSSIRKITRRCMASLTHLLIGKGFSRTEGTKKEKDS